MSTVPFIVFDQRTGRPVRCGLCQPEMVAAQANADHERSAEATTDELAATRAQLMPSRPPRTDDPPSQLDLLVEVLRAEGIAVDQAKLIAAAARLRSRKAG